MKLKRMLAILLMFLIAMAEPAMGQAADAVFTPRTIDQVQPKGLRVFRLAQLPMADDVPGTTYLSYPLSIALHTLHVARRLPATRVGEAIFVWSNRCDTCRAPLKLKPNAFGVPVRTSAGADCRVSYTSYVKANAATTVHVMAMLGYPRQQWLPVAVEAGFGDQDIHAYAEIKANPDAFCRDKGVFKTGDSQTIASASMTDQIVLPEVVLEATVLPSVYGIILDAEWADNRSEEISTAFLTKLAQLVHAKGLKFGMSNNPLVEAGWVNGLGDNLNALNQVMDDIMITVAMRDKNRDYGAGIEATLAKFRGARPIRYGAIDLEFPLGVPPNETTLEQAEAAHVAIEKFGLGGVMFAPAYHRATGLACDLAGRKIQAVLGIPTSC